MVGATSIRPTEILQNCFSMWSRVNILLGCIKVTRPRYAHSRASDHHLPNKHKILPTHFRLAVQGYSHLLRTTAWECNVKHGTPAHELHSRQGIARLHGDGMQMVHTFAGDSIQSNCGLITWAKGTLSLLS